MKKTHEKSRFEIMSSATFGSPENTILQIADKHLYTNRAGLPVFLCETVDKKEFDRNTIEAQLERALKDLEKKQGEIDRLTDFIKFGQIETRNLRDSVEKALEKEMKLKNALKECKRIFRDLPKEIEELI